MMFEYMLVAIVLVVSLAGTGWSGDTNIRVVDRPNIELKNDFSAGILEWYIDVTQFVLFQPVVEDLSSIDRAAREQALTYFETGCRIGKELGDALSRTVVGCHGRRPRLGRSPGGNEQED